MKKARVTREMPFAKVGEEFEINKYGGIIIILCGHIGIHNDKLEEWIKDGWLEWVEEEKSLECPKCGGKFYEK